MTLILALGTFYVAMTLAGIRRSNYLFPWMREFLADFGTVHLMVLGLVAIVVMLKAPKGVWGLIRDRYDLELFPLSYRVRFTKKD